MRFAVRSGYHGCETAVYAIKRAEDRVKIREMQRVGGAEAARRGGLDPRRDAEALAIELEPESMSNPNFDQAHLRRRMESSRVRLRWADLDEFGEVGRAGYFRLVVEWVNSGVRVKALRMSGLQICPVCQAVVKKWRVVC